MSLIFDAYQRRSQPWLLWPYFIYRLKKFFKVGFVHNPEDYDQVAIDVVLVTIHKDYPIVQESVKSLVNICHKINKVFIVSKDNAEIREICLKLNCVFIDEDSFLPVKFADLDFKIKGLNRTGWIFQQLLKFGADTFVEMPNFLILESDTVFINRVGFIKNGKFIMGNHEEWHQPYFEAFKKLFGFEVKYPLSFIVHMMIYNKALLAECKRDIEKQSNLPWYQAYMAAVDRQEISSIADYENYAHWLYCKYPEKLETQVFYNTGMSPAKLKSWQALKAKYGKSYNSVSFHSYLLK